MSKHEPSAKSLAMARHEAVLAELKELRAEAGLEAIFESPKDPRVAARIKELEAESSKLLAAIESA